MGFFLFSLTGRKGGKKRDFNLIFSLCNRGILIPIYPDGKRNPRGLIRILWDGSDPWEKPDFPTGIK